MEKCHKQKFCDGFFNGRIETSDVFFRYPKDSVYKLYQRRGMCLMKLGQPCLALEALQEALSSLDGLPTSPVSTPPGSTSTRMSVKKKASLARDLRALATEAKTMPNEQRGEQQDKQERSRSRTSVHFFVLFN